MVVVARSIGGAGRSEFGKLTTRRNKHVEVSSAARCVHGKAACGVRCNWSVSKTQLSERRRVMRQRLHLLDREGVCVVVAGIRLEGTVRVAVHDRGFQDNSGPPSRKHASKQLTCIIPLCRVCADIAFIVY